MISLGAVLEQFPEEVVVYVTDPRTGIQRRSKWPPTISEVLEACEAHQDYLVRMRKPRLPARPALPPPDVSVRPPGYLGNTFIPATYERYSKFVEWAKTADPMFWRYGKSSDGRDGIWIPWNIWDSGPVANPAPSVGARQMQLSETTLRAMRQADEMRDQGKEYQT